MPRKKGNSLISIYNLAVMAAVQIGNPLGDYWAKMTDPSRNPFRGLYHLNGFDLLIVVPYFAVLTVLAAYGLHRYWLVYSYVKYRNNLPPAVPDPAEWPRVTVQLPIYNERYVIERLIETVARFDYPGEKLEIQVLDDSTDETQQVARACVERYQALGLRIQYLHRDNREGYKAGALAEGLKAASGEFIAIFDADFLPPADFLRRTVPYFGDAASRIGMVQTRWTYLNRHYSALTEVESILLDGHFVIEHGARARSGCFFNFNGTAGVWRRAAIEDAGGWQHDTLTEDTDLSYRAQLRGWQFYYLPHIECPSELPVEMNGFKAQQARWAKGLVQTAKKILPRVLRADLPGAVKTEAVFHLTAGHQLSADDCSGHHAAACDDRAFLPGLVADAVDRPAAIPGLELLDLRILSGVAAGALSQGLGAHGALSAVHHGRGHRTFGAQRQGRAGSARGNEIRVCAHAEIPHRRPGRHLAQEALPQSRGLDAMAGDRTGVVLRRDHRLRHPERKLPDRAVSAAVCVGLPLHRADVAGARHTSSGWALVWAEVWAGACAMPEEVRPAPTGVPGF